MSERQADGQTPPANGSTRASETTAPPIPGSEPLAGQSLRRSDHVVIPVELLFLLLTLAILRVLLAPGSKALTTVLVLWALLTFTSYLAGEFETPVRLNFGLTLRTQAAFALAYVGYSGLPVVWPWCESLTVRFWLVLWVYLNLFAPLLGLLVRRMIRQQALFVTDTHRDRVRLLNWWGFDCREIVATDRLADWLKRESHRTGEIPDYSIIVVDVSDHRVEHEVNSLAREYFVDFIGVSSFTMTGYLLGPHPHLIEPHHLRGTLRRLKRLIDLGCSTIALVLFAPLFIAVALLIKLDSRGPVFYRHRRLGRHMKEFWLLKFRTMHPDADARLKELLAANPDLDRQFRATYKLKNDPRITRLGRILRKTSIDELPQFFNIIAGQMSVVGPRPIVKDEVRYYEGHSLLLFRVLPGATGLWQVSGRSETGYDQRVALDTRYVREWNLLWDLKILLTTIPAVLRRRGAY
ncbi:MAG TPA: sugar transferase [candidate division WOR-3 bacterium]|uniref:Sugar transferase n=1 Tax=candidate division WOR-3 bacterium TaxID=2052148 RepID=A0A7V0T480_UNCW3|nr:sugar transferase [candidate division WOR-3 bacterium]